jgi:hypothetical protein
MNVSVKSLDMCTPDLQVIYMVIDAYTPNTSGNASLNLCESNSFIHSNLKSMSMKFIHSTIAHIMLYQFEHCEQY